MSISVRNRMYSQPGGNSTAFDFYPCHSMTMLLMCKYDDKYGLTPLFYHPNTSSSERFTMDDLIKDLVGTCKFTQNVKFDDQGNAVVDLDVYHTIDTPYHRGFRLNNNILFRDMGLNLTKYYSIVEKLEENGEEMFIDSQSHTHYGSSRLLPIFNNLNAQTSISNEEYGKQGITWNRNCLIVHSSEIIQTDQFEAELYLYDLGPNKLDGLVKEVYNKDFTNEHGKEKSIQELIQKNIFNMKFGIGGPTTVSTISQWQDGIQLGAKSRVGQFNENIKFNVYSIIESSLAVKLGEYRTSNQQNPVIEDHIPIPNIDVSDIISPIQGDPSRNEYVNVVCCNSKIEQVEAEYVETL